MSRVIRFLVFLLLLGSELHPRRLQAQQDALSLQDVEYLLSQGVSSLRVQEIVSGRCIAFRPDAAAISRLRAAGADETLIRALPRVCSRVAAPPPVPAETVQVVPYDPGTVALQSLLVPGWGQFDTGRPGMGVLFGAAGLVALGVAAYEETPDEADPSYREAPYATAGLAAYAAIAVLAAIDAYSGASAANVRARSRQVGPAPRGVPSRTGVDIELVRFSF